MLHRRNIRIIPRLDVKNNTIVKGIHLEGLRVVGNPSDLAFKYYKEGADEILYMDAVASLYERNGLHGIVSQTAKNIFIPLTVGGGIRTIEDIEKLLRSGADKIAINTGAIKRPAFIQEAANRFGSQCIVVSIEAKKIGTDKWEAYIDTGREATGVDSLVWAKEVQRLGAGELLITSIDHEGTKKGFEIELVKKISEVVSIPVIACGGVGCATHVQEVIDETDTSGIACGSIFHYGICPIPDLKIELKKNQESVFVR